MPVGLFSGAEFVIIGIVVLIFFGYKWLPRLGRSAGDGTRRLGEGAKRHAASAQAYVDEHTPDAGEVGRSAGKHVREYRELKDTVMGTAKPEGETSSPPPDKGEPTADPGGSPAEEPQPRGPDDSPERERT